MIAEIILISTGTPADLQTGVPHVARALGSIGVKLRESPTSCANRASFAAAVSAGLGRSNILVTIGGMGPQSGFIAKQVLAEGLGLPLEHCPAVAGAIAALLERSGGQAPPEDDALAALPQGAHPFVPAHGKLPGCAISSSKQHIIMLPENPAELPGMLSAQVLPYLSETGMSASGINFVRTYGISETKVCDLLADLTGATNPLIEILPEGPEVLIRVTAHAASAGQATALCTPVLRNIVERMGDNAYGLNVDSLETAVVQKLHKKDLDIAIAEAGTGGILARVFSEYENSDGLLRYAACPDNIDAKTEQLGIAAKMLKRKGNLSEYAAVALANGARQKGDSAIGVGIAVGFSDTGEGLAYIAVCDDKAVYAKKLIIAAGAAPGNDAVVDAAVSRTLNMVRLFVDYLPARYKGAIPLKKALGGYAVTDQARYSSNDADDFSDEPSRRKFSDNFIIRAQDASGEKVRKLIFILAMLVLIGSLCYIGHGFYNSFAARQQAAELQAMFMESSFDQLLAINPDLAGYLMIEGTSVSYPIVQAQDNDFYLRKDFYGRSNNHGIPFMDYRVNLSAPSDNLVIYGHNMKDGQIFGEVLNYRELDYYAAHPVIHFHTPSQTGIYKIIGVFIADGADPSFAYHNFIEAETAADMEEFLQQVALRSLIQTTVDAKAGDKLLTLSTCTYEFDQARFVVVARQLRFGETADVDTAGARQNPQPLYPAVWYSLFGGSPPLLPSARADLPASSDSASEEEAARAASEAAAHAASEQAARSASEAAAHAASEEAARSASEAAVRAASEEAARSASEAAAQQAKQQEAARKEAIALTAQATALKAVEAAQAAAINTENAASPTIAHTSANQAQAQADIAAAAAKEAKTAAGLAGTAAAQQAAADAERHAINAASYARDAAAIAEELESAATPSGSSFRGELIDLEVISGGKRYTDTLDILVGVVQNEVGSAFHPEAIKAQAVAAYTYIAQSNAKGETPTVYLASSVSATVQNAVEEVLGQAIYYNGKLAFTPYHATSAGDTASSKDVWGGHYPYLISVDSAVDRSVTNFRVRTTMSADKVAGLLKSKLGITADGDPANWFEILSEADGGYNGNMAVCGYTKSRLSGNSTITGRLLREQVLGLRSACFSIDYNDSSDTFTFTTYGYGHGVGMSQNGANLYARDGWSYIEILEHYYPGTTIA